MDDIIATTITPYTRVNKVDTPGVSATYYHEKDHLGSITRITTNTGGIIDEYSYTVFGKAYKKDPLGIYRPLTSLKSDINNTRLYTGREYDRETNLYYLRARYYDANLGRFISRDPIGTKDNVNLYSYVANSPIGYVDRMGLGKILIVGFYGWNLAELDSYPANHNKSGVGKILDKIEESNKGTKNQLDTLHYTSGQFSLGQKYAKDYIVEKGINYYDRVYIIGHSMGGDSAIEFSNTLNDMGIQVNGLYTLDIEGVSDDTEIQDNVLNAENYYQTHEEWKFAPNNNGVQVTGIHGNYSNIEINSRCDIFTCEKGSDEDAPIHHTNIDDELIEYISNKIFNSF